MKIAVVHNTWSKLPADHALALDGFRWQKLGPDGEPEMFATDPPEKLLEGMCRAAGFSGVTNAHN